MNQNNSIFENHDPIISELKSQWPQYFDSIPQAAGRAPGRLTLIGDHIDYSGFASLMIATQGNFTTILIAETKTNLIRMRNMNPQFPPVDVPINPITEKKGTGWSVFPEGAVKSFCQKSQTMFTGIDILITSTVPISSGLSSSGALLCSITAALDVLANTKLPKDQLIEISINAEHMAGFLTGGMDQNLSFYAKRSFACLVSFNPQKIIHVNLPPSIFVVAHCNIGNSKIDNPLNAYNQRLLEVTKCAELMMAMKDPSWTPDSNEQVTIRDVVLKVGPDNALTLAKALPESEGNLVLRDRAIHVIEESERVKHFCTVEVEQWGKLLNDSHESLNKLFSCSCPEMNDLVETGRRLGAMGARLTGSGWGGCALFLLKSNQDTDQFISNLKKEFYEPRNIHDSVILVTHAGPGAEAIKI